MSHYEWVTHVNAQAKAKVDECNTLLDKLEPLYEDMTTCIETAGNEMEAIEQVIIVETPVGSGDYYDKYTESRDTWDEEFGTLASDAGTTSTNLAKAISDIQAIKAEWEPKVYYTVWEEVDD